MQRYIKIISNDTIFRLCRKIAVVTLFLLVTTPTFGQSKTVLIDDNKITVEQALHQIEQQTGYLFVMKMSAIDLAKRIELPKTRTSLDQTLELILAGTGYGYQYDGKNILIVPNQQSQSVTPSVEKPIVTQTIGGVVVDDQTGHPLVGARVSVSGVMGSETVSDHAGRFTIKNVPTGSQRIRTYLDGYYISERGVQITSSGSPEIQIPLKTTAISLGSVRSTADKGGIVTAEVSEAFIASVTAAQRDTVRIEPVQTYQSAILSPYLHGVNQNRVKFGIKTNLLYLATMSPNLGVEWAMGRHWTGEINAGFSMFKYGEIFRKGDNAIFNHWLVKPEVKYWTCRAFDGHFFGVHGLVGQFRVADLPISWLGDFEQGHEYEGSAIGAGLTYGYQWAVARRWNLEASLGVGYVRFTYDDLSVAEDCKTCYKRDAVKNYLGPTKAAISMIYTF